MLDFKYLTNFKRSKHTIVYNGGVRWHISHVDKSTTITGEPVTIYNVMLHLITGSDLLHNLTNVQGSSRLTLFPKFPTYLDRKGAIVS